MQAHVSHCTVFLFIRQAIGHSGAALTSETLYAKVQMSVSERLLFCSVFQPENTVSFLVSPSDPCSSQALPVPPPSWDPSSHTPHLHSCQHSWSLTERAAAGSHMCGTGGAQLPLGLVGIRVRPSVFVYLSVYNIHT